MKVDLRQISVHWNVRGSESAVIMAIERAARSFGWRTKQVDNRRLLLFVTDTVLFVLRRKRTIPIYVSQLDGLLTKVQLDKKSIESTHIDSKSLECLSRLRSMLSPADRPG